MKRIENRLRASITIAMLHVAGAIAGAQEPADSDTAPSLQQYAESLRGARDSLMAASDYEAALEPARLVVEALEPEGDASVAGDKIMLSVILAELQRYDDAQAGFLSAIETLEDAEGQYTESMIMPLRLLGRTYIRARQFPQAVTALNEARAVSRRTSGLFNVDQAGVLDDLTTAHLGLGDTLTARELQIERLETAQRQFGASDPRVIPFHYHLADYYERSRLLSGAREQYETARAIAEAANDAEQVLVALRNTVAISLKSGGSDGDIERLREIVEAGNASDSELGLANAVLGDAAIVEENPRLAANYYAEAWRLLDADGSGMAARYFADPAVIQFVPPASPVDLASRTLPYSWGTISIEFDVDERGRVESINGVGAAPAQMMETAYVERLQSAWFRPALSEAVPVEARGVILTHYFRYYVEAEEDDE